MANYRTRPERPKVHLQIAHKAGIAQQVEQRTRNAKVVGSIPIAGTIKINKLSKQKAESILKRDTGGTPKNKSTRQLTTKRQLLIVEDHHNTS